MSSPPSTTAFAKTTRPAIGAAVPRGRLFSRLDGDARRRAAWICGAPGGGKTTLAASYVEARGLRSLWYQVDADDADVATFFHFLAHAARKLERGRSRDFPSYAGRGPGELSAFARRFFRQLFAQARPPFALVIDNLNAVPEASPLHQVLEVAIGEVPRGCAVIVTSRSDPPAELARFRATGELTCVDGAALRIDAEEAVEMVRARGHSLPGEAIAQLQKTTQGWAAGMVLLLEHAKLSGGFTEPPGDAPPQVVFDFLAGEIFRHFEPSTRRFLLRIACLPRMSVATATALSEEPKAGRLLVNLALNNYFVSEAQAESGRVYQLHPLLRQFLLSRAADELPEVLVPGHLRRAADLLAVAGQVEDAVPLLVEAQDWDGIARIAALHAAALLAQGRSATLAEWIGTMPPGLLDRLPALVMALGECHLRDRPREARRCFEQAHSAFGKSGDEEGALRSACAVVGATLAEFDDLAPLDRWRKTVIELMERRGASAAARREGAAAVVRAMLIRGPGGEDLEAWVVRAELPLLRAAVALRRGDGSGADAILQGVRRSPEGAGTAQSGPLALALAVRAWLDGDFAATIAAATEGLDRGDAAAEPSCPGWLHALVVAAALAGGDQDQARSHLHLLEHGASIRRGDRALLHYLRGWQALLESDSEVATREARSAVALAAETGWTGLECLARCALAGCLAAMGDRKAVDAQLRAASGLWAAHGGEWLGFCLGASAAGAYLSLDDEAAMLPPLRSSFSIGRETGMRHVPWMRTRDLADLCVAALRQGVEPGYATAFARAFRLRPRIPALRVKGWPWPFRVLALGRFELQRDGEPVEFSGKGPGRPMELLKVLLASGGQAVRADQLGDALWPHVDADYAHKSFTATLHRLRRLLGDEEALVLRDGRLSLDPGLVWVDSWALEQALAEVDEVSRALPGSANEERLLAASDEALGLYRGPFLADEVDQPSYLAQREHLRARMLRCVSRVARGWTAAAQPGRAALAYQRLIDADPLFEAPYRNLMLLHRELGDTGEGRATYERLRTVFATRLKTLPSPEAQAILATLGADPAR